MTNRTTFIGLVALVIVLAGAFWVRSCQPLPLEAPAGPGQATGGTAVPAVADDDSLPDVTLSEGTADLEDVRLAFSVSPNPPVAFAKFRVRVTAFGAAPSAALSAGASAQWPLAIEGGRVSFEMTMPMGEHRYSLVAAGQGGYEAEAVLPLCASGKRRWYATVEGTIAGRPRTARFRFDLAVPK